MPRRIEVEITGDSRGLERAFDRSAKAAQNFNRKVVSSRPAFDPLLKDVEELRRRADRLAGREEEIHQDRQRRMQELAGTAAIAGGAVFGVARAFEEAAELSKMFAGENAQVTKSLNNISKAATALTHLDPSGFVEAVAAMAHRRPPGGIARTAARLDRPAEVTRQFEKAARLSAEAKRTGFSLTVAQAKEAQKIAERAYQALPAAEKAQVTNVYLDGDKVGRSVKRFGQRDQVRSPSQKRGPNARR
jgi:hypothetical protein